VLQVDRQVVAPTLGIGPRGHRVLRRIGVLAFFAVLWVAALAKLATAGREIGDGDLLGAAALATNGLVLGLMAVFFLAQRPVVGDRATLPQTVVAIVGGWTVLPLSLLPLTATSGPVLAVSALLNTVASVGICYALTRLGRSFSVLPEARKLVTEGPYRWVRHPIYTMHILTMVGIALPRSSALAALLLTLGVTGEILRARLEERALLRAFPAYADYQARTKRFLPWVY
jgi:protein-S-isoprenylcysteine O-methyltransferase Ste14